MGNKGKWLAVPVIVVIVVVGMLVRPGTSGAIDKKGEADKPKPKNTDKATTTTEQEKELRKTIAAFSAAFNKGMEKGDVEGIMAFWTDDAEFINENGKATRGKAALCAILKKSVTNLKGHKHAIKVGTIRFPKPDVALEDSVVTTTSPDGVEDSGPYASLWVKVDGKWKLSSVRDLPEEPEQSTKPAAFLFLKGLSWMVGQWSDKAGDTKMSCRWAPNQVALLMEYTIKRQGGKMLYISQRIGWDPVNSQIRSWFFDSDGGYGEAIWTRDGNAWDITTEGYTADGLSGTSTNRWKFVDQNTAIWSAKAREVDEQPLPDLEVKYSRVDNTKDK